MPALCLAVALGSGFFSEQARSASSSSLEATDPAGWDLARLYRTTWSVDQMIGATVRGKNGQEIGEVKDLILEGARITHVVVEVGGFFELGDQHIGVRWKDIRLGPAMSWIQVPLREVESGTYSLYGAVRHGEDVYPPERAWRANELLGDFARLTDVPRFGIVADLLFDDGGTVQAIVVDRAAGGWGRGHWYAFPFIGYRPDQRTFHLPYTAEKVTSMQPFSYQRFAAEGRYASDRQGRSARSSASAAGGVAR